ncbi:hypothetical protein HA402_000084 [Bradysia odoriphaga]|nr:hypothetical protein HA402_000084 [Bradysia odoriphaga]
MASPAIRKSARIKLYQQKQQKLLELLAKDDSENDSEDDEELESCEQNNEGDTDNVNGTNIIDSSDDDEEVFSDEDLQVDLVDSSDNEEEDEQQNCNPVDDEIWTSKVKPIPQFAFDDASSGVKIDVNEESSPRDIFDKIFSKDIVDTLINATNNYGKTLLSSDVSTTGKRKGKRRKFRELDKDEFGRFIGLCLLQGQTRSPTIRKLFSKDPLYYHPIFGVTMSGRRFQQILRCFTCELVEDSEDKLTKIRPLVNMVRKSFQEAFSPNKNLSLDESLLLFRGRLSIRQYIKIKAAKYGIEFFELTTPDGYVLNFEVYEGKDSKTSEVKGEKTQNIVLRLMEPYLSRGHHVYMDNYYNSIRLSERLLQSQTHSTGTLRSNRKGNPKDVIAKKLKKGELVWKRKGDVYISKWKDKRDVLSITTAHHPALIEVANRYGIKKNKPTDIAAYNDNMGGIDRADQMVSYYSSPRKTIRWYKKVLFHLLDLCVWNSFYIFKQFHGKGAFLDFRDSLIRSLIQLPSEISDGKDLQKKNVSLSRSSNKSASPQSVSNSGISKPHYLEKIPLRESTTKKSSFLRCRQCSKHKIRRETSYRCRDCIDHPPLCPTCVEAFHN